MKTPTSAAQIDWVTSSSLVPYEAAVSFMEQRAAAIRDEGAREMVWCLEHPPLYTGGTSAKESDLLNPQQFNVYASSRGGQYTYHGPGQRVVYVLLDLDTRGRDIRAFVRQLEEWIITTLAHLGVKSERRDGRVGVWVDRTDRAGGGPLREDKIAALGVRVRRWVSFHGIAINVEPDLSHFGGITPCGISEDGLGVTSLVDLGIPATLQDVDFALEDKFLALFGPSSLHRQMVETVPALNRSVSWPFFCCFLRVKSGKITSYSANS